MHYIKSFRLTLYTALVFMIVGTSLFSSVPLKTLAAEEIPIEEMTVDQLIDSYENNEYTAEKVIQAYLNRIDKYEGTYNAFTFLNEQAIEEAKEIDRLRAEGADLGPLAGIPIVIKEAVDVAGYPSTFGWAPFSKDSGGIELMPVNDAPVVTRLKEAGAIILGKTNIPAFSATGTHANTSWDGPTYNAVNPHLAPGGSSSGTAMAVSGNFAILGIAEETGGSIQNPAAAQAIVGIKPSFGLIPTKGVTPLAGSTRDVLGPHARTVKDSAIMLDVIAGYSEEDPKTKAAIGNIPESGYTSSISDSALEGKRLGLYGAGWRESELTDETKELYERAIEELENQGAVVVRDPFASSGFAEYVKSVNYKNVAFFYDLEKYIENLNPEDTSLSIESVFGKTGEVPWTEEGILKSYAELAEEGIKNADIEPDLTEFLEIREEYQRIIYEVMEKHNLDGFVYPQMTKATPPLGGDNITATTVSEINFSGLPLITVPAGYYKNGSPFALAFFSKMWSEADLIGLAYDYEQATHHRETPRLIETSIKFSDVAPNNVHFPAIATLSNLGLIKDKPLEDGTYEFRPDQTLNRYEAAELLMNALELPKSEQKEQVLKNFKDVDSKSPYAEAIAATYTAGIFKGSKDGNFMGNQQLSREQMASLLIRTFHLEPTNEHPPIVIDIANMNQSYIENVKTLIQHEILEATNFNTKESVSRGQFVTYLYRALNL